MDNKDENLDSDFINNLVLTRLKEFVDEYYGSYSAFAAGLGMTVSTITSMFNRKSLPSGPILLGIKRNHPDFNLDYLYQDVHDGLGKGDESMREGTYNANNNAVSNALIHFLQNNEIKLNVTLNNDKT